MFALPLDDPALLRINRVSIAPVVDAPLQHLQVWLRDGNAPPIQPLMEFAGAPALIVRDGDAIACGGLRLPQVEVPLAHNSAIQRTPDVFARLVGSYEVFTPEEVRRRSRTKEEYMARFEEAARAAVTAGIVLPRDMEPLLAEASEAFPF
jgi:Alpha/beta hydrolase domain